MAFPCSGHTTDLPNASVVDGHVDFYEEQQPKGPLNSQYPYPGFPATGLWAAHARRCSDVVPDNALTMLLQLIEISPMPLNIELVVDADGITFAGEVVPESEHWRSITGQVRAANTSQPVIDLFEFLDQQSAQRTAKAARRIETHDAGRPGPPPEPLQYIHLRLTDGSTRRLRIAAVTGWSLAETAYR